MGYQKTIYAQKRHRNEDLYGKKQKRRKESEKYGMEKNEAKKQDGTEGKKDHRIGDSRAGEGWKQQDDF